MSKEIVINTLKALQSNEKEVIVSTFNFGSTKENELLVFFKPEVFFNSDENMIKKCIEMTLAKLEQNEIIVNGAILFKGEKMKELEIMDRHYGFINYISKNASKLSQEDLNKIYSALEITDPKNYKVYGGHEFLAVHPEFDAFSLDAFWQAKKSVKVRSGFYTQKFELKGENIILVNAFHPVQLEHYIDKTHKTLVVLCNSDKNWSFLRDKVAGDTFPERAVKESIRGEFYANKDKYGLKEVSIAYNCVHMSAGPFEAGFEIDNFLKKASDSEYEISRTNLFSKLSKAGIKPDMIVKSLTNPKADIVGKITALFDVTENKDTTPSVNIFSQYYTK